MEKQINCVWAERYKLNEVENVRKVFSNVADVDKHFEKILKLKIGWF